MINVKHIETDITSKCQNACISCDHYAPMQPPVFVSPKSIEDDLKAASKFIHTNEYGLLGGEPLLHPQLLDILDIAIESKFADSIQIVTNGQKLKDMPEEFWKKLDRLWVTRYPGKLSEETWVWISNKCSDNGVTFDPHVRNELWHTFSGRVAPDIEAQARFSRCFLIEGKNCYVLDKGFLYLCCAAPFVAPLIMGLPEGTDGVFLPTATEQEVMDYLGRRVAFEGCKRCVEVDRHSFPWSESRDWFKDSICNL